VQAPNKQSKILRSKDMQLLGLGDRFFGMKVVKIDGKKEKITVVDINGKQWKYRFFEVENNLSKITKR
jgi:hypothetical protein